MGKPKQLDARQALEELEAQVDTLVTLCNKLLKANDLLIKNQDQMRRQQNELRRKTQQARTTVERVLGQLKPYGGV